MATFAEDRPLFQQIAEQIEDAVLSGAYAEETQVPSITEFAVALKINPATALKGVNLLVDEGLLYKKRGVGMFVAEGARERLKRARAERFFEAYIVPMLREARRLGFEKRDLIEMTERGLVNEY